MINLKLDDLEVAKLIMACNTAITYYDDLINSKTPFTKEVLGDFVEAKKNYQSLSKKLGAALLQEDSIHVE